MKKIVSIFLLLVMAAGTLSGCGGSGEAGGKNDGNTESENRTVAMASAGTDGSCGAILNDGSVYIWGKGYYGDGEVDDPSGVSHPKFVMDNAKYLSVGPCHSAVITEDGTLYMWGENVYGQIDSSGDEVILAPRKIMDNVKTVAVVGARMGTPRTAVITEDGSLYSWGRGLLGTGNDQPANTPVKILENAESVALGTVGSLAVTKSGELYCWGRILKGDGSGALGVIETPVKIMDDVKSCAVGSGLVAVIKKDGSLYMWGSNKYGQVGIGTTESQKTPVKVMDNVKEVALGDSHALAVTGDGELYTWGFNEHGQLGDNSTENKTTPVKIMDGVVSVDAGTDHSAALTKEGDLYIWGYSYNGQLCDGGGAGQFRGGTYSSIATSPEKIDIDARLKELNEE